MIIRLDYPDRDIDCIKASLDKNVKKHYIRYRIDEYCFENAVNTCLDNKWVVALDYEGDISYLYSLENIPNVPIIVTKNLEDVSELTIHLIMSELPDWVLVSIRTPRTFCDMRLVSKLSKEYKNIRFCGGKFIRLHNCNIGCIGASEMPVKIPESKIRYATHGCACILETLEVEDVEGIEYVYRDEIERMEENKKKIVTEVRQEINSISDLFV